MRRKRFAPLIFIVLLAAIALGAVVGTGTTPQLGLDLQGGVSVVLQPTKKVSSDALDETISIIRSRVDALGVAEPQIARQGGSVIVQLPGVKNQQRALQLVGDTAELRFRPVISSIPGSIEDLLKQQTSTTSTTKPKAKSSVTSSTVKATTTTGAVTGQSAGSAATPYQAAPTTTVAPTTATTAPKTGFEVTPREKDLPTQPVVLTETDSATKKVVSTYQLGPAEATGRIVSGATAELGQSGQWTVRLKMHGGANGIDLFNQIAAECHAKAATCPSGQLAIVLDSNVVSAPTISEASYQRDQIQISGSFTQKEAKDLALVLRYGSLPVNLEPQTVQTVSPTLGSDSLKAGLIAGLVGLLLVVLYMLVYYRALGVVVLLGLMVWSALNYAVICWLGASQGLALGLSGVTGLVVSVGVTVDSYVVYFERLKEEVAAGRNIENSTDRVFKRAFRTIIAANVSSLIGAVLLYLLTVGPVRGFAFFLGLATSLDVVVAWYFIRPMVGVLARNKRMANNRVMGLHRGLTGKVVPEEPGGTPKPPSVWSKLYHGTTDVNFVGRFKRWIALSGLVLIAGAIAFAGRGLNLGIDFKGGVVWEVPAGGASVASTESAMSGQGLKGVTVQTLKASGQTRLRVEAESVPVKKANEVTDKLASLTHSKPDEVSLTSVGPSWGKEISHKALRALIFFLIAITLYITFRFELRMAVPTLVALVHDVLITVGVYSIAGFQVTPATVVALLTILGFSIYDGIVVFDKVDELTPLVGAKEGLTYSDMVNRSLNHVLMRSLNTSITALLPVASLLFLGSFVLGATTLEEFALALLIGLFAGAYSSIFIASPMLAWLKEKEPRYRAIRERIESKQAAAAAPAPAKVPAAVTADVGQGAGEEGAPDPDLPVITRPAASSERVIPPRPRKKGKKR